MGNAWAAPRESNRTRRYSHQFIGRFDAPRALNLFIGTSFGRVEGRRVRSTPVATNVTLLTPGG